MSNNLATRKPRQSGAPRKRRPKGWTPERRALQAELTRIAQPWRHSTGPRTDAGKARVAMNGLRHGMRSRVWLLKARRIRAAIRLCADTVLLARVMMLMADGAVSRRIGELGQRGLDALG